MQLFVAWSHNAADAAGSGDAARVAARLQRVFAPVLGPSVSAQSMAGQCASVAVLDMPTRGWRQESFERDEHGWALAADHPLNAAAVLGAAATREHLLLPLCRALQRRPGPLLADLSPPFCLVWSDTTTGDVFVQNDGLGHSQLYEYDDGTRRALSNKIFGFAALGLPIEPEPTEWAAYATLGWFPMDTTGYRHIRFVRPGTQFRLGAAGITATRFDVLSDWVHPEPLAAGDCLELGRESLRELVAGCLANWEAPEVGLTGGWDSRAVVSTLRSLDADFTTVVRGIAGRPDVVVATELARIAGLELKVVTSSGLPADDAADCREAISRALLWQGGHAALHRHKTFLVGREHLRHKRVNVTGQHGEIARRERAIFTDDRVAAVRAGSWTPQQYEALVLDDLLVEMPPFLTDDAEDAVRQAVLDTYHQADRYGLEGLARVDFFALYEFTRRKGSGVHAWQPRQVIAPFLNPGFIRAVFVHTERTEMNEFHRHIIRTNSPDWNDVPFAEDLDTAAVAAQFGSSAGDSPAWRRPTGRENYDGSRYWQTTGRPLIEECLAAGGSWTEVFDPDRTSTGWQASPDILAMLHVLPEVTASVRDVS